MPLSKTIQNEASQPIGINIVGQSPHVFVYRFWSKQSGASKWDLLRDGDTQDDVPDHFQAGPFADGTEIAYWVAISGKENSAFRFSVVFAQGGRVAAGSPLVHQGKTSAEGGAVVEHGVVLI